MKRSPVKLPESTHHQLNMYALAAGATGMSLLVLAQPSEARIVYTPDHHKLTHGQLLIDLNHDGVVDFLLAIKSQYWTSFCSFCGQSLSVNGNGNIGAGVIGNKTDAAALHQGAMIGPHDSFQSVQNAGRRMAKGFDSDGSTLRIYGQFANTKNRFLGLRFKIHGKTHYGWVRFASITVTLKNGSAPIVTAVLNGYAYETIPGKSIIAGKTKGPDEAPNASLTVPASRPATLGMLALGAPALSIWRKEELEFVK